MGVTISSKGDFAKTDKFFKKSIKISNFENIIPIAENCIRQLKEATPKDSGLTAESWRYKIIKRKGYQGLLFENTNIQNGINVALLLEYGHVSRGGTWVEGNHFVTPTTKKAYDEILNKTWKEMTRL